MTVLVAGRHAQAHRSQPPDHRGFIGRTEAPPSVPEEQHVLSLVAPSIHNIITMTHKIMDHHSCITGNIGLHYRQQWAALRSRAAPDGTRLKGYAGRGRG